MTEISKPLVSLIAPPSSEQNNASTKLPQPVLPKVQAGTIPGLDSDLLQRGPVPTSAPSTQLADTAKPSAPTRVSTPPLDQSQKQAPALTVAHKLLELYGEAELAADVRASRLSGNPDDRRDAVRFLQEKLGLKPDEQTGRLSRSTKEAILGGLSSYIRGGQNVSKEVREDFRLLDLEVNPPSAGPTHDNLDAIREGFVKERREKLMGASLNEDSHQATAQDDLKKRLDSNVDLADEITTVLSGASTVAPEHVEELNKQFKAALSPSEPWAMSVEDSPFLKPTKSPSADVFMKATDLPTPEETFLPVGSNRPEKPGKDAFLPVGSESAKDAGPEVFLPTRNKMG